PISVADQKEYVSLKDFTEFLRKKTYMLSNSFDQKGNILSNISSTLKVRKSIKNIVTPVSLESMKKEVESLRKHNGRLLESKNYEVFFADSKSIPNILTEIGRLREITFREVGEGTNEAIDLDAFDNYYHHMFLWDNTTNKVAGAYRMGLGSKIFATYGIDGFYLQDLFRFEPELYK